MSWTRRQFLWASLGVLAAGCAEEHQPYNSVYAPYDPSPRADIPAIARPPEPQTTHREPVQSIDDGSALRAIPRSTWTNRNPSLSNINLMNGVARITVHHEGFTPVEFDDVETTQRRIQVIQNVHTRDRNWADIGYHFIVDRAGRLWQGRDLRYQGAHVRDNNPHNVGIMLLGNFDKQRPSPAQMRTLLETVTKLQRYYRVGAHKVQTHQEIVRTACPGRTLQAQVQSARVSGYFG